MDGRTLCYFTKRTAQAGRRRAVHEAGRGARRRLVLGVGGALSAACHGGRRTAHDIAERLLLIVDDDDGERAAKIRALAACKHVSVLGTCSRDCVDAALTVAPRALLVEATASGELGPDVHRVLELDHRISAIIWGHERAERARRRYPRVASRFVGIAVPVRAEEIAAFIAQPPLPESWAGFFTPAECLRAAGIGEHSLSIDCVSADGSRLGFIAVERGAILRAQTSSPTGFEAFRELVTSCGVRAVMRPPVPVEPQPDLAGGWEFVLLEALRLHDQERRHALATQILVAACPRRSARRHPRVERHRPRKRRRRSHRETPPRSYKSSSTER
jgi:hypothetical protein